MYQSSSECFVLSFDPTFMPRFFPLVLPPCIFPSFVCCCRRGLVRRGISGGSGLCDLLLFNAVFFFFRRGRVCQMGADVAVDEPLWFGGGFCWLTVGRRGLVCRKGVDVAVDEPLWVGGGFCRLTIGQSVRDIGFPSWQPSSSLHSTWLSLKVAAHPCTTLCS